MISEHHGSQRDSKRQGRRIRGALRSSAHRASLFSGAPLGACIYLFIYRYVDAVWLILNEVLTRRRARLTPKDLIPFYLVRACVLLRSYPLCGFDAYPRCWILELDRDRSPNEAHPGASVTNEILGS